MSAVRVASWNIHSLRKRLERLVHWLGESAPDIVCLQETKCTDEQFPADALRAAGDHAEFHGEKSYNGVAILARAELCEVRPVLCDQVGEPQARVLPAPVGPVRGLSVAAPPRPGVRPAPALSTRPRS